MDAEREPPVRFLTREIAFATLADRRASTGNDGRVFVGARVGLESAAEIEFAWLQLADRQLALVAVAAGDQTAGPYRRTLAQLTDHELQWLMAGARQRLHEPGLRVVRRRAWQEAMSRARHAARGGERHA